MDHERLMTSLEQAAAHLLLAAEQDFGPADEMRELAVKLQVMTSTLETGERLA